MRRCVKTAALALLMAVLGLQAGCGNSREAAETTSAAAETAAEEKKDVVYLSMATSGNWSDILRGDLWEEYCRKLEAWSDGTLIMKTYYGGALGGDLELIEGVTEGTLCIINSVPSYQISAVPEAALLDVPGLFESTEEYNDFIENYYLDTLQSFYHRKGIRLLSSSAFAYRVLTSNTPVHNMEDLSRLKLRTMENKYHVAFWQAMGASVISMNWNEVRLAIQQNILQAQENPLGYMISSNLQDVQDQVILTNHVLMISNFLMNEQQYEALSPEHKELLQRFFDEMSRELVERQPQEDEELIRQLTEEGVQVYDASEDIRQAIAGVGQPMVLRLLRQDLGNEIVDDFLDKVIEAKNHYREQRN